MKRVRVSKPAQLDLADIWNYIATRSQSIKVADSALESLTDCFLLLANTPKAGTKRDDLEIGVSGFPIGKYIVYHRQSSEYVVILRVIHGMRDQRTAYLDNQ